MENNETQNSLSLSDLWNIFTSHYIIIIVAAVLVFAVVTSYSVITYQPEYTSSATIYILRQDNEGGGSSVSSADFSLALSTVNDCTVLLTSHIVLDRVIEKLGMTIEYEDLKKMISIRNPPSTRILEVSVRAPSPSDAKIIADELCRIGAQLIIDTLGINQVNLIDEGTYSEIPSNSMITPYSYVAALLAAVVTFGIYVLIYILDDKIKSADDVEKFLGLTVLGLIPNFKEEYGAWSRKYKYGKYYGYQQYGGYVKNKTGAP